MFRGYKPELYVRVGEFGNTAERRTQSALQNTSSGVNGGALFEVLVKELLVEKHVGVAEALVESVLHLLHTAHDAVDVRVARWYACQRE